MTEKRFYYNTFYHADDMSRVLEYEIIDRQSYPNYPYHDEKEDIPNWYIYIDENDSGWQDMLVELLNALHEENEQLKQDMGELQNDKLLTELQMKCDKKQEHIVVLENKIRRMREAIHKLEWLASHRNADLQRENAQLKSENQQIRDTIKEMYNNERTSLGKSVLKQLLEAIQ